MSKIYHMSMSISLFMGFKVFMLIMVAPTAVQHGASGGARNPGMRLIRHLPFCFAMIIICPVSLSLTDFKMLAPCSFAACLQVSWLLRGPSPLQAQSWYAFQHSRIYDSRLSSNVMCINFVVISYQSWQLVGWWISITSKDSFTMITSTFSCSCWVSYL